MPDKPTRRKAVKASRKQAAATAALSITSTEQAFAEVVDMIQAAKVRTFAAVNTELVDLYWRIGEYISRKLEAAVWGEGVVDELARYIGRHHPGQRGFTRSNLFRMRQFFETYRDDPKVATVLRQLPWSHNLLILARCKLPEQREFYLRHAARDRWSYRELDRQMDRLLFERAVLHPAETSAAMKEVHPEAEAVFRDAYVVEFLNLPKDHREADLHRALLQNLRLFMAELGPKFCFVGSEVPVQVGRTDFSIDLLFYHRGLRCLVAIELKITKFKPEHLGKLEFYLEALDRDFRLPDEGPSIGMLLCADKDDKVVEYALNRSMSPTLIAKYQTELPDRRLLEAKLHEYVALAEASLEETSDDEP